jgi:hypothetical protein
MTQGIGFYLTLDEYYQLRQFIRTIGVLAVFKKYCSDRKVEMLEDGTTTREVWDGRFRVIRDGVVEVERPVSEPVRQTLKDGVQEDKDGGVVCITIKWLVDRIPFRPTASGFRVDVDDAPVILWTLGHGNPRYQEMSFDPAGPYADALGPYFQTIRKWIKAKSKFDGQTWVFMGARALGGPPSE